VTVVPEVVYAHPVEDTVEAFTAAWTRNAGIVHHGGGGIDVAIGGRSPVVFAEDRPAREALAVAAVGVVPAVCAIGATGTVVIDSRLVRAASLLPPVCVFVIRVADVVKYPGDVLRHRERWWPDALPSQIVFVSGPSRSGDIELNLVQGVHGPGEVHAVFIDA
jgi:L-lactate dehydrogenase complex protein LldG